MKFGKVDDPSGIDIGIPADDPATLIQPHFVY